MTHGACEVESSLDRRDQFIIKKGIFSTDTLPYWTQKLFHGRHDILCRLIKLNHLSKRKTKLHRIIVISMKIATVGRTA